MISRILLAALLGLSVIASTPVPSAAPSVDAINMTNITVAPSLENVRGLEDDDEGQNDNILPGDLGRKDKAPASCNHNNGNIVCDSEPSLRRDAVVMITTFHAGPLSVCRALVGDGHAVPHEPLRPRRPLCSPDADRRLSDRLFLATLKQNLPAQCDAGLDLPLGKNT